MEPTQQSTPTPLSTGPAPAVGNKKGDKKRTLILLMLGLLIIVALGILVYLLWGNRDRVDAEQPVTTVSISTAGFIPATIKIKKGQEIAWLNEEENPHEIFADQEAAPSLNSAGPLLKGDTYVYKFEKEGTINYYDPQDPTKLKGTIIVE
jgi:plastocyanin